VENSKAEPTKRVMGKVWMGDFRGEYGLAPEGRPFDFIFGIGSQGLTPLEYLLFEKSPGQSVETIVKKDEAAGFAGHIDLGIGGLFKEHDRLWLKIAISSVETVTPREVVKAIAQSQESCGGGCGCGCGE